MFAAFAVASLLKTASVTRRIREFGTLKALGWSSSRIVGQVMCESIATGVAGAVTGMALGLVGAALIDTIAPTLTASVGGDKSFAVHLVAPVSGLMVGLAVSLALSGSLIAGGLGGWRAARLRPADALARV